MAQTFMNAIMCNDPFAFRCIEKYIKPDIQKHVPGVASWEAYIVQLALPYEEGNIQGGHFVYD